MKLRNDAKQNLMSNRFCPHTKGSWLQMNTEQIFFRHLTKHMNKQQNEMSDKYNIDS